ncbi:MAG: hypothetical protein PVH88_21220 [Ignavibacteria bacterium]|jgi:hypothetical protein
MKNYLLLILLVLGSALNAQSMNDDWLKLPVVGLIEQNGIYYLQTEKGLLKIQDEEDALEKYYQKVYGDSTIQNPNTILNQQNNYSFPNFIVPQIDISEWSDQYTPIRNMYLHQFIKVDDSGNIFIIDGALQKYYEKLKMNNSQK